MSTRPLRSLPPGAVNSYVIPPTNKYHSVMSHLLATFVGAITRFPRLALVVLALVTAAAGYYALTQFRVNAEQLSLIAPDAEFQQRYEAFRTEFPVYRRTTVVVVEAPSQASARTAAIDLADALAKRDDLYQHVFTAAGSEFLQQNGILYLSTEELIDQLDALVQAQPGIAIAAGDKGLSGLLTLLRDGATQPDDTGNADASLISLADALTKAAQDLAAGQPAATLRLTLGSLQRGGSATGTTAVELIAIQIREDLTDFMSPRRKLDVIRQTAADLGLTPENGVRIRLTGNIPLSVEELTQVRNSLGLAGALSLLILALVLGFGVRSVRIVSILVATLAVGGVWSMAWAMASVGEVNLLSASFAILFVGLGVDFAIHFALRAQEGVEQGMTTPKALTAAAREVGPAIALGAATSAIGFLSFVPTEYRGFADLGIIAGGGMALAFLAAITLIPAAFAVLGVPAQRGANAKFAARTQRLFAAAQRHARAIVTVAVGAGIVCAALTTQAQFDFSTLSLKNTESESIRTLADLQERGLVTDYAAYILAPSIEDAQPIAETLAALPAVGSVRTVLDLIPDNQDEKLALIDETAFVLFPLFGLAASPAAETPSDISLPLPDTMGQQTRDAYGRLEAALAALSAAQLNALNTALAAQVAREVSMLTEVFNAQPITALEQVPITLRERFISPDGTALVVGLPKGDVTKTEDLRAFVSEVKAVFPDSTGRAVIEDTVGGVVVHAFMTALLLALSAISVIIFLATRSLTDTVLILMPLLLAALATTATGVLIGMPFNQANIIVLPLIMGLGVDNGIHLLTRYRQSGSLHGLMGSSTTRAIVLSTLTTIGAFGSLAVSQHPGTASMGMLLTIAMSYLLIATVLVLPAALSLLQKPQSRPNPQTNPQTSPE